MSQIRNLIENQEYLASIFRTIDEASNPELKKYGIKELRDDLTLDKIKKSFPWLIKAKLRNATIGADAGLIQWYNGDWLDGTWEDGVFYNGNFIKGTWKDGTLVKGKFGDQVKWINGMGKPKNVK